MHDDDGLVDPWLGRRLGNYRVDTVIGRGGMASVYEASHVALGTVHALKILEPVFARHPDVRARFLREGRVQAQFRHAGIARVTDTINGPAVALVMERLTGESLRALLDRGPVSPAVASLLVEDIADALAHAHAHGVVHRDIKPDNVFLAEEADGGLRAVLLDFGIARVQDMSELTQSGVMMGTPRYMSPEQLEDPRAVDPRTDVFALGVVLYELLAGVPPHPGEGAREITMAILGGRYPRLSARTGLPAVVDQVVDRALAPDRERRFASVQDLAAAAASALAVPAETDAPPPAPSNRPVPAGPAETWPPVPDAEVEQVLAGRAAGRRVVRCRRCGTRGFAAQRRCEGCGAKLP
jgi:serine/threonine-protein kinase